MEELLKKTKCRAKLVNHPLDPEEWDCDCKEAKNGEACKYLKR